MTPLPSNPIVIALVDKDGKTLKVATNVAPDTMVKTTTSEAEFNELALGKTFTIVPES
jgi:hypothetical protein